MKVDIQAVIDDDVQESAIKFNRLDPKIKYYTVDDYIDGFGLKKPVSVLDPFTTDEDEKKIIRAVLEDYLESIAKGLTRDDLAIESERVLPRFHSYKNHYYLLAGLGGYIRNRRKEGFRPEFIEARVGSGSDGAIFKIATVIFDEQDSFILKRSDKKPRALKRRISLRCDQVFINVMSRLPYEEYKLKQCFYVMENGKQYLYIPHRFFEGLNLTQYLARHRLTGMEKMSLEIAAGEAVEQLHLRNIIHRDIKSTNLMVSPDGKKVVIVDYDYAMFPGVPETIAGSPMYFAPECFKGKVSYKTDSYATLMSFAEGFGALDRLSAETERRAAAKDSNIAMLLNIKRAKEQQKFRKFAVNDKDIPLSLRKLIKTTLRAGTDPASSLRLPLSDALIELKAYQSLFSSGDPAKLHQLDLQYIEKYLVNKIKEKWSNPSLPIQDKLTLLNKAINKLPDNAECIKKFFTALEVQDFANCPSKKELHAMCAMLDVAYEAFVAMSAYIEQLNKMAKPDDSQLGRSLGQFKLREYRKYYADYCFRLTSDSDINFWITWANFVKKENPNFIYKQFIAATMDMICMCCRSSLNSNRLNAENYKQHILVPLQHYFALLAGQEGSDQDKMLLVVTMLTKLPQLAPKLNAYAICFLNTAYHDNAATFIEKIKGELRMTPEEFDQALARVNEVFEDKPKSTLRPT